MSVCCYVSNVQVSCVYVMYLTGPFPYHPINDYTFLEVLL